MGNRVRYLPPVGCAVRSQTISIIDVLKGSYYANPILDLPVVSMEQRTKFPEYYSQNVWPDVSERGIEGFEDAFKSLGKFVPTMGYVLTAF